MIFKSTNQRAHFSGQLLVVVLFIGLGLRFFLLPVNVKAVILIGENELPSATVSSSTPNQSVTPATLAAQLSYSTQRQKLLTTYKAQIIAYQNAYQRFRLAKTQYQKTQTIRSLNEAINATKLAALKRNEVLSTYIEILHLDLLKKQTSLDPSLRGELIKQTEMLLATLKQYHYKIKKVVSREQLNQTLTNYSSFFKQIVSLTYKVRLILKADGLFNLDFKLKYYKEQIVQRRKESLKTANFRSVEFKRGLDEVDHELDKMDGVWQLIKQSLHEKTTDVNWFRLMNRHLSQIYTTSLRTNNYLIELLQIK